MVDEVHNPFTILFQPDATAMNLDMIRDLLLDAQIPFADIYWGALGSILFLAWYVTKRASMKAQHAPATPD